jgi:hypothetical protein
MAKNGTDLNDRENMPVTVSESFEMQPHFLSHLSKEVLLGLGFTNIVTVPSPAIAIDSRNGIVSKLKNYNPAERFDEGMERILAHASSHKAYLTTDKRTLR